MANTASPGTVRSVLIWKSNDAEWMIYNFDNFVVQVLKKKKKKEGKTIVFVI